MTRALAIGLASALSGCAAAQAQWTNQTALPRAVAGHAAAREHGELWVAGGSFWEHGRKSIESMVWRLHASGAWERTGAVPGGFAHGATAATPGALWLIGGLDHHGVSPAIRRLDLRDGTVRPAGQLPQPLAYAGAAAVADRIWILGGTPVEGDFSRANHEGWTFSIASGALQRFTTSAPRLISPIVLPFGDELHVLPGSMWSAERRQLEAPADVWIYSLLRQHWRSRPLPAPLPRGMSGIVISPTTALLTGGIGKVNDDAQFSALTWLYEAGSGMLRSGPALPAPRLAGALAGDERAVYFFGGEDGPRRRADTVWKLPLMAPPASR